MEHAHQQQQQHEEARQELNAQQLTPPDTPVRTDGDDSDGSTVNSTNLPSVSTPLLPSRSSSCSLQSILSMPSFHRRTRSRHGSLCFDTPLKTAWVGPDMDDKPRPEFRRTRSHENVLLSPSMDDSEANEAGNTTNLPTSRSLDATLRDCRSWDDLPNLLLTSTKDASTANARFLLNEPAPASSVARPRASTMATATTASTGLRQRKKPSMKVSTSMSSLQSCDHDVADHSMRPSTTSSTATGMRRYRQSKHSQDANASRARPSPTAKRSRWVIPMEHPLKILWDTMTVVLSFAYAYATHAAIRDRKFGGMFMTMCDIWFMIDILLNFTTERRTAEGTILRDHKSIFARYLTSWFAIDTLSLFPWEHIYVQPILDVQKRRGFWMRNFFRSKAVIRVTAHLRTRHVRWFGKVARHTKHHGVGAYRLLRLIIKYLPKYMLFLRNMKGAIAFRLLRQVNYFRRLLKNMPHKKHKSRRRTRCDGEQSDNETGSLTEDEFEDDLSHSSSASFEDLHQHKKRSVVEIVYDNWALIDKDGDDDDDGVPL
mmetsp:Transcript_18090/g.50225  ORF Transcript_18090/g.50225 Transcript_18090/m.50225 type:complete len:542 (-) Transcript_18090:153-1778(-)|eukprot:CAMPEP_0198134886 /NCGR_PEP_ID=MMETSP1442-20131203/60307_1 /TAXON_ID= /ORGANISM="Craspedostauros australis, Strain CCMP3328" /LENGTH=541 /DNA_ID=CAMNT_0043796043 /DNA_START=1714 /DNA_END=3339 /DNA_ORIENTATION=+